MKNNNVQNATSNNFFTFNQQHQLSRQITGFQISRLFFTVRTMVSDLLAQITELYKANCIRYSVNQFYTAVLRMLCPVELHALYNQTEISFLLGSHFPKPQPQPKNQHQSPSQQEQKQQKNETTGQKIKKNMIDSLSPQKNQRSSQIKDSAQDSEYKISNQESLFSVQKKQKKQGRGRRKKQFSGGFEKNIVEWAMAQIKRGRSFTRLDIREMAGSFFNKRGFKASARWCEYFLARNVEIRNWVKPLKKKKGNDKDSSIQLQQNNSSRQMQVSSKSNQEKQSPIKSMVAQEKNSSEPVKQITIPKLVFLPKIEQSEKKFLFVDDYNDDESESPINYVNQTSESEEESIHHMSSSTIQEVEQKKQEDRDQEEYIRQLGEYYENHLNSNFQNRQNSSQIPQIESESKNNQDNRENEEPRNITQKREED